MDISMMLPYLDQFPHAKLLVNYRGYGLSTGSPTEQAIMGDSLAILDDVLKETGRTPDDVILVGQSLGSGVATQIASVRNVKKLVLLVPFDSLLETARDLFPYLPVKLILPDHFRSDLAAPKVSCPVSILAAGSDEVIPPAHAKRLRDCFSTPVNYQEFPGAMHNTIWHSPGLTGHSPKASVTEPDYEREARETLRKHSPACSSSSQEASSGNASGNRLAHSTTSTASPSRYSSQPIPKSSDSSRSR